MTDEEFDRRKKEELERVPPEFRSKLSDFAWDKGHAYGYSDILIELSDVIDAIEQPLKVFEQRIRAGYDVT